MANSVVVIVLLKITYKSCNQNSKKKWEQHEKLKLLFADRKGAGKFREKREVVLC